ncbi:hypothetical protein GS491_26575 [Rhodococcus hoagii]|nr:hypothetical protein [Prescottella equi]NKR80686.1 hypothetical protein [Prescottella equi]NKS99568.1 hypothetical protein [Prescottella equi]
MTDQDLHRQAWELGQWGLSWAEVGEEMGLAESIVEEMASRHSRAADADAASTQFELF